MAPTAPKLAWSCSACELAPRLMRSVKDSTKLWAAPALMIRKLPLKTCGVGVVFVVFMLQAYQST